MSKYKCKFIVINIKHIKQLQERVQPNWLGEKKPHPAIVNLEKALTRFANVYERTCGRKLNQKYYVCNQDEPYAKKIIKTILKHEAIKENKMAVWERDELDKAYK